ncbi:MAG: heavy metal-responsive transcriptional regulator, partial [Chloroflexota bacterium]
MYSIGELSKQAGVSTQTIRYYESIGLLPDPMRASNGYRQYKDKDIERLKFITRARQLDFSLDDVNEILALKEKREAPCRYVMEMMTQQIQAIEQRIADLQQLHDELHQLHEIGLEMPDDVEMKNCICHVIQTTTQKELIED